MLKLKFTATLPPVFTNKQRIQSPEANLEVKTTMRIPTVKIVLSHTSDCLFTVETHGIKLTGSEEISSMFRRLWANHQWVKHDQFCWVEEASSEDIAVRFRVTNKLNGGGIVNKSNCNFFTVRDGLFSEIRVYMAGENTLNKDDD
ncbi:hypothetical protein N9X02_00630 [Planktomarina temperata]|nr:hypothetical protein [Planktomarina temperata]